MYNLVNHRHQSNCKHKKKLCVKQQSIDVIETSSVLTDDKRSSRHIVRIIIGSDREGLGLGLGIGLGLSIIDPRSDADRRSEPNTVHIVNPQSVSVATTTVAILINNICNKLLITLSFGQITL